MCLLTAQENTYKIDVDEPIVKDDKEFMFGCAAPQVEQTHQNIEETKIKLADMEQHIASKKISDSFKEEFHVGYDVSKYKCWDYRGAAHEIQVHVSDFMICRAHSLNAI